MTQTTKLNKFDFGMKLKLVFYILTLPFSSTNLLTVHLGVGQKQTPL